MKTLAPTPTASAYSRSRSAAALLVALATTAGAQPVWTGASDNVVGNTANWTPALTITSGTTTNSTGVTFGAAGSGGTSLTLAADLQFAGGASPTSNAMLFNDAGFTIAGSGSATRQLTIGGQGLAINTANTITLDVPRIRRNASNTFEFLGSSGNLVINGSFSTNITAAADTVTRVDFTAAGGNNNTITFNGAIVNVFTGAAGAGLGQLTTSSVGTGNRVVFNNASNTGFTGTVTVGNNVQVHLGNGGADGTLSGTTAVTLGNSASRFVVNQSDTVTQGVEFASSISGLGALVQDGAGTTILNAGNSFGGGTQINEGVLLVSNTTGSGTGSGNVTVASGAALGGDGIISGSVTFDAGAKFVFSIDSTLDVNGASVSFGGFGIDDLTGLDGSTAAGFYTLIGGSASISATNLSHLGSSNAFDLGSGKSAYFDLGTGDLQVVVSAIPEPSAFAALAGLGAIACAGLRRRRRAA